MVTIKRHGSGAVTRAGLAAGVLAPLVFVPTFTVDGWRRADYDPVSMFVSELSIGPGGWVQKANFVVTGLLVFVFAISAPHPTRAARVAAGALAVMGGCLFLSGFFTTDHAVLFTQLSAEGRVHGILGAIFFLGTLLSPTAGAVDRDEERTWRRWSAVVAAAETVGIVALKLAELQQFGLFPEKGLVQRACLVLFFGWLAAYALRLRRRLRPARTRRRRT